MSVLKIFRGFVALPAAGRQNMGIVPISIEDPRWQAIGTVEKLLSNRSIIPLEQKSRFSDFPDLG